ncbi:hypothetical protein L6164_035294 [Bauhinia variegata]|uniref:Uncharacterized protein n=1 Tax=Bauhinia variegata TaxID=167791 RepID=A0ACB9KXV1_BAUVA|nr:hypothetical protein L6164_035294 [Bauhinia variegata]
MPYLLKRFILAQLYPSFAEGATPFFTLNWSKYAEFLTFRGGLDPVTGGLWLTDIAHHHLAIAILFLIAGHMYRTNWGIGHGSRCIAIRNQDIGIGLVNQFITFQTQPISIRTPFTCRSTSWICRLCYGRSPTHGDLVELGEAVGIIAGQSIGEPGTQLTLRNFHTGGVFTGGTAEHVRAPSNGKIKFNEDLVHPTRTRHARGGREGYISGSELQANMKCMDTSYALE